MPLSEGGMREKAVKEVRECGPILVATHTWHEYAQKATSIV